MTIVIGGCRNFNDRSVVFQCLDEYLKLYKNTSEIIFLSGHCSGVDLLAEEYAKQYHYKLKIFPAEWGKYGRAAGSIRNKTMVEKSDVVIAFWDGKSRGTKNLIELAKKSKCPLYIHWIK